MRAQPSAGTGEDHEDHVVQRLAEYFSCSLSAADETAIEAHLLTCADCRAEYQGLGETAALLACLMPGHLDDLCGGPAPTGTARIGPVVPRPRPRPRCGTRPPRGGSRTFRGGRRRD